MKRFYTTAGIRADDDEYTVVLDDRPVRTPERAVLAVPTPPLARAIADEWERQDEQVDPRAMPLMRLAATAIDRVSAQRDAVVEAVAGYAETDLVCYRAETPAELAQRQAATWQPLLDWLAATHSVELRITVGIMPRPQDETALDRIRTLVAAHDDFSLSAVQSATATAGSVVLALALAEGRMDAEEAAMAAHLEELYQAELWGDDREARSLREARAADLAAAERFLELLREDVDQ